MVKGSTRQVVVVKAPDAKLFEQAIFILREDAPQVDERALLQEAHRAAEACLQQRAGFPLRLWLRRAALLLTGAGATGAAWLLTALQ